MVWLRALAALALLGIALPAAATETADKVSVFGESIQQQVQPQVERIQRQVYRDDVWVPAPRPPRVHPDFPGVPAPPTGKTPSSPAAGAGI